MRTSATDQTTLAASFKEAAFTARMAEEDRKRARKAWRDAQAAGAGYDAIRALEVLSKIAHARATVAADLEDEAWADYAATLPHG